MSVERNPREEGLISSTRKHFIETMAAGNPIHDRFPQHVMLVEEWALKILEYYPEADELVVLLSVWLHDIGAKNKKNQEIHEIYSEKETRKFLGSLNLDEELIEKVAHCVRTHRCKEDALPESIEAKILAAADSASHLTDFVYLQMRIDGVSKEDVKAKLERDLRDISMLPKPILDELVPLGDAWEQFLDIFPETKK